MGEGVVRLDRKGLVVAGQRFERAAELEQRAAAIAVRLGQLGLQRQRLVVALDARLILLEHTHRMAQAAEGCGAVRIDFQRLAQPVDADLGAAQIHLDHAQHVQRIEMRRLRGQHLKVRRLGLFQRALLLKAQALLEMRRAQIGRHALQHGIPRAA